MGNAAAPAAQSGLLQIEKSGAVLMVGLNRPAKLNAWTQQMMNDNGTAMIVAANRKLSSVAKS